MDRVLPDTPDPTAPAPMPAWISALDGADAQFRAGAALAHLHGVAGHYALPAALWRARLALLAAGACAGFAGRRETASELRDALYLRRDGDHAGPGGEMFRVWSVAVARPVSAGHLAKAVGAVSPEWIRTALDARGGTPVDRAADVLGAVLDGDPRAELAGLLLADAVLARGLGWSHLVPLLSTAIKPRDLRLRGADMRGACLGAVAVAAGQAVLLAADLARRSARLRAVAPMLRAKGAGRAVDLFLTRDALTPAVLAGFMSDRAARRLCDRLVSLGGVRELSGRDSFRIYGV